jgi:hypothetical protein
VTDAPTNESTSADARAEGPFNHGSYWYLPCDTRVLAGRVHRRWERFDRHMRLSGTVLLGLHVSQRDVVDGFF